MEVEPGITETLDGCAAMLQKSLLSSDLKAKSRDIVDTVICVGGSACFGGVPDRCEEQIASLRVSALPADLKFIAPADVAVRRHAAFVGGSIFACLGSFEAHVISKAEYDDAGPTVFTRRCP